MNEDGVMMLMRIMVVKWCDTINNKTWNEEVMDQRSLSPNKNVPGSAKHTH